MKLGRLVAVVIAGAAAVSCSGDDGRGSTARPLSTTSTTTDEATSEADGYADDASWLCRPETEDVCDDDLDATIVEEDGTTSVEAFVPARDPSIDCFYVYPTVSMDPEANSDLVPGPEEENVVRQQAARLGSVCALYAPMYHQATLTALRKTVGGGGGGFFGGYPAAYTDVLDAWRHYLAVDNDGRGVIIIGHSQGAGHLLKLLREEIDPDPEQRALLVSAMLLGTSAHASETPHVPPCTRNDQTGCLVSWSTFRDGKPPPQNSFFARPLGDEPAVCTNPAALGGGSGDLHPYFSPQGSGVSVTTEFVTLPGLVSAECRDVDGFNHLAITVHPGSGPRIDDVRGDLTPEWGMHLIDVNVAMGDLVALAASQAAAYSSG